MKDERQPLKGEKKVWTISLAATSAAVTMAADGHDMISFQRRDVVVV